MGSPLDMETDPERIPPTSFLIIHFRLTQGQELTKTETFHSHTIQKPGSLTGTHNEHAWVSFLLSTYQQYVSFGLNAVLKLEQSEVCQHKGLNSQGLLSLIAMVVAAETQA